MCVTIRCVWTYFKLFQYITAPNGSFLILTTLKRWGQMNTYQKREQEDTIPFQFWAFPFHDPQGDFWFLMNMTNIERRCRNSRFYGVNHRNSETDRKVIHYYSVRVFYSSLLPFFGKVFKTKVSQLVTSPPTTVLPSPRVTVFVRKASKGAKLLNKAEAEADRRIWTIAMVFWT